ncbi:MAG: transcriptional repressor LexA [Thermodesulfobacteriota bacterium]
MARGLTDRQKDVLDFIEGFMAAHGYPPSVREVAASLGISGAANAAKHLAALERKGYLRRRPGLSRAMELAGPVALGPAGGGEGVQGGARALSIPIAGRVRAGEPHLAVEDVVGRVVLDERFFGCADAFMLQVEGESMTGAGIDDGDFVIVRPQPTAESGDIVVALIGDEATVKRFMRKGADIILKPENPEMEPITLAGAGADGEGGEVSIIGRVISVIKRVER